MLTRRDLLAAAAAAPFAARLDLRRPRAVLTTDFAVPHADPDDFYDVACAAALGFAGVVADHPTAAAAAAVEQLGGRVLDVTDIRKAESVVVVGAATNAARHHRRGQRVVLFAGDAAGVTEYNQQLDPDAYDFLRAQTTTRWVPCFDGGPWGAGPRASWIQTTDRALLEGQPAHVRGWFDRYIGDVYGLRNLWAGPLLRFAWADRWHGHSVAAGVFRAGAGLAVDVVAGTRRLLSAPQLLGRPALAGVVSG